VSIKHFFTSYFDSLSDKETRHHLKNEIKSKIIENQYFNFYEGKENFSAVILQIDSQRPSQGSTKTIDNFLVAKVRPIDIHDFIIPNPCEPGLIQGAVEERIDLHPTAYSDFRGDNQILQVGQIVECYYETQGPEHHGKQRGLRFSSNMAFGDTSAEKYDCLERYSEAFSAKALSEHQSLANQIYNRSTKQPMKPLDATERDSWPTYTEKPNRKNAGKTQSFPYDRLKFGSDECCSPKNPDALTVQEYFTDAQWQAYVEKLSSYEGRHRSVNPWGYVGRFQYSLGALKRCGLISGSLRKKALKATPKGVQKGSYAAETYKSVSIAGLYSKDLNPVGRAVIKVLSNNRWQGKHGVYSLKEFLQNKNRVQEKTLPIYTNGNFDSIRKYVEKDNLCDTAGKLAFSHLVGPGHVIRFYKNIDRADGNGAFGSRYYIGVGTAVKAVCS